MPVFKKLEWLERLLLTTLTSFSTALLFLIFSGTVFNFLRFTSYTILFIGAVGFILFIKDIFSLKEKISISVVSRIKQLKFIDSLFVITILFFIFKFIYYLSVMAIMNWDVLRFYLPLARTMYTQDSIPVLTGFDFTTVRGGFFGISTIYAFVYSGSGSIFAEDFRFLPLLFFLAIVALLYIIARDAHSKNLGKLSVLVFFSLPFVDEMLVSYSYYPDVLFLMLFLGAFWLIWKFTLTKRWFFAIAAGFVAGSVMTVKPFGILVTGLLVGLIFQLILHKMFSRNGFIYRALRIAPLSVVISLILLNVTSWFGLDIIYSVLSIILVIWILNSIDSYLTKIIISFDQKKLLIGLCSTVLCSLPFFVLTFGRNFLLFGSPLYVSWMNEESTKWAIQLTQGFYPTAEPMSLTAAFGWMMVIFTTSALGTAFLFPKVLGLSKLLKKQGSLFFIFAVAYFIVWFIFMGPAEVTGTTARWLYPLVPFITLVIAYGFLKSVKSFKKSVIFIYLFLAFSLLQSRLLSQYPVSLYLEINDFFEHIGLSQQVLTGINASPTMEQILGSLYLGIIVFLPLMIYYLFQICKPRFSLKMPFPLKSRRYFQYAGFLVIIFLSFSLILLPVMAVTFTYGNGNPLDFAKNSRSSSDYRGLYSEILPYIETHSNSNETIICVDAAHTGLQYYLPNVRIVDIIFSENLAIFWPLIGKNVEDSVRFLTEINATYFLVSKSQTSQSLLSNLSKQILLFGCISDPFYFEVLKETSNWKLVKLRSLTDLTSISNANSTDYWSVVWGGSGSFVPDKNNSELGQSYLTVSEEFVTKYVALQSNTPGYWNFTNKNHLTFFFKCDTANLTYRVRIYDYELNWADYYFAYTKVDQWQSVTLSLEVPSVSSAHVIETGKIDNLIIVVSGEANFARTICVSDILVAP